MPVAVCQALNRGQIGMAKLRLTEGAPMKKKLCGVALAVSAALPVGFVAMSSPAAAQPPGQCKKVNGNCNGKSESAPPHCAEFPLGWQKKLGC